MSEAIIGVEGLSRWFGRKLALANVSLGIPSGIVFGLVGENGAGKTTLIKHVLGLYGAQAGRVAAFGADPVRDPPAVLGRIGYLAEDRDLPEWMRIAELTNYTRAFYPRWDDRLARELIEQFERDPRQKIRTWSRGERARRAASRCWRRWSSSGWRRSWTRSAHALRPCSRKTSFPARGAI